MDRPRRNSRWSTLGAGLILLLLGALAIHVLLPDSDEPTDGSPPAAVEEVDGAREDPLLTGLPEGGQPVAQEAPASGTGGGLVTGRLVEAGSGGMAQYLLMEDDALRASGELPVGPIRIPYARGEGDHWLELRAGGCRPQRWNLPQPSIDLGEVRFSTSVGYGGTVVDSSNAPVPGVRVELRSTTRRRAVGTSEATGVDGRFLIQFEESPAMGADPKGRFHNYTLVLRRGREVQHEVPAELSGTWGAHVIRFEPVAPARVRFVRGGAPVPGLGVKVYDGVRPRGRAVPPAPLFRTRSDETGTVEFPLLPIRTYYLLEIDDGGRTYWCRLDKERLERPVHEVAIDERNLATVRVAVTWESDGAPVEGAAVWLVARWEEPGRPEEAAFPVFDMVDKSFALHGRCGPDGSTDLTAVVPPGSNPRLVARARAVESTSGGRFYLEVGEIADPRYLGDRPLDIRLQGAAASEFVLLSVRDSRGVPVVPTGGIVYLDVGNTQVRGGVDVGARPVHVVGAHPSWLWFLDDHVAATLRSASGGGGLRSARFLLTCRGLTPRRVDLDAQALLSAWANNSALEVSLPEHKRTAVIRVKSAGGGPAVSCLVGLSPMDTHANEAETAVTTMATDSSGTTRAAGLEEGREYAALAWVPRTGAAAYGVLPSDAAPVELVLEEPWECELHLEYEEGGAAWPAEVRLATNPEGLAPAIHAQTDRHGVVRLGRCVPSLYGRVVILARNDALARELGRTNEITHRMTLRGADLTNGMTLRIPRAP